jgi:hypothetical protein
MDLATFLDPRTLEQQVGETGRPWDTGAAGKRDREALGHWSSRQERQGGPMTLEQQLGETGRP